MAGRFRPPLVWGRYSMDVFANFARPAHFSKYLVAVASKCLSTQVMGRSSMVSSHERRGQMLALYSHNFCCLVTGQESTFCINSCRCLDRVSLA